MSDRWIEGGRAAAIVGVLVGACGDDGSAGGETDTTGSDGTAVTGATTGEATGDASDTGTSDATGATGDTGGSGSSGDSGGAEVTIEGGVQKGPFVLGSSVDVVLLDAMGEPTGEVFPTVTTSHLGEFEVSFMHDGPVEFVAEGYYYNEVTGELSTAPITLRALHHIDMPGPQPAFVNLVTHLTERRALALLSMFDVPVAVGQAEQELVTGAGIGPAGFDPGGAGIDMNLLGGDTLANAYLFALSAIMVQAAAIEAGPGGSVDGTIQAVVNAIADDLEDGTLDPANVQLLDDAERALITDRAYELLAARLSDLGIMQAPPNLDLVVDTDADDFVNAMDTCPWVANPAQQPILDDVCHARASYVADAMMTPIGDVVLAALDGDGNLDAVMRAGSSWGFFAGDGTGGFTFQHGQVVADQIPHLADMNADGIADVVVDAGAGTTKVYLRAAGFDPLPAPVQSTSGYISTLDPIHGDMNNDGFPELMRSGSIGATGTGDAAMPIQLLLNDGAGGFTDGTATAIIPMGTSFSGPAASALVDVTSDPNRDYVVVGRSMAFPDADLVVLTFPGDGAGNLGAAIVSTAPLPVGGDPLAGDFSLADVTGDGIVDAIVVGRGSTVMCMPGNPDGTFGPAAMTDVGIVLDWADLLSTGDFTGDGIADLLVRQQVGGTLGELQVYVIPSLGAGTVGPPVSRVSRLLGPTNDGASWAAAADFDGNGADDLLLSTGEVSTMMFTP